MKFRSTLLFVAAVSAVVAVSAVSSCKRVTDATLKLRVVENTIDQLNTMDTIQTPVVQAEVRFYQDERPGTLHLEETMLTNTNGEVEFVYPYPAILKYDVTHSGRSSLENFVILEEGETIELVLNLDEL